MLQQNRSQNRLATALISLALFVTPFAGHAQAVQVDDGGGETQAAPANDSGTGKDRAKQYFQKRGEAKPAAAPRQVGGETGGTPRYLALHIGRMFADQSYKWGDEDQKNLGGLNAGVTYRLGEWVNSMDFAMRMEYTNYSLYEGQARKVSLGGLVTFPDSNSRFPLYFGGGLGLGMFVKQLEGESVLALDYQLIGGARFLNVYENLGFMVEAGIKNHLLLLSYGQYNGVFINVGTVFAF